MRSHETKGRIDINDALDINNMFVKIPRSPPIADLSLLDILRGRETDANLELSPELAHGFREFSHRDIALTPQAGCDLRARYAEAACEFGPANARSIEGLRNRLRRIDGRRFNSDNAVEFGVTYWKKSHHSLS